MSFCHLILLILVLRRWALWEGYLVIIFLVHGVKGFSRGSTMRLGRLILGGGIVFTVGEDSFHLTGRFACSELISLFLFSFRF